MPLRIFQGKNCLLTAMEESHMGKNQHVVPRGNEWAVRGENKSKASSLHSTQKAAIDSAVRIAKSAHAEVVIHGRDGRIRDKDSYGIDPAFIKDMKH